MCRESLSPKMREEVKTMIQASMNSKIGEEQENIGKSLLEQIIGLRKDYKTSGAWKDLLTIITVIVSFAALILSYATLLSSQYDNPIAAIMSCIVGFFLCGAFLLMYLVVIIATKKIYGRCPFQKKSFNAVNIIISFMISIGLTFQICTTLLYFGILRLEDVVENPVTIIIVLLIMTATIFAFIHMCAKSEVEQGNLE